MVRPVHWANGSAVEMANAHQHDMIRLFQVAEAVSDSRTPQLEFPASRVCEQISLGFFLLCFCFGLMSRAVALLKKV